MKRKAYKGETMIMVALMKNKGLYGGLLILLVGMASSVSASELGVESFSVLSTPIIVLDSPGHILTPISVNDVRALEPIAHTSGSLAPLASPPISNYSNGGHSTLTTSELFLVMDGGRNFNPITKKWGYREPFTGQKRNNFMLSWEASRVKNNVNQLIPYGERYSK